MHARAATFDTGSFDTGSFDTALPDTDRTLLRA